jgi:hypothetical protein
MLATASRRRGLSCSGRRIACISKPRNRHVPPHFLTSFNRTDTFALGKELVGENRGVDRILRSLKLHAEGRQFGDQNS